MRPLIAATAVVALLGGCAADRDAWLDAHGRVDRKESRNVPEGTHYAAFSSGRAIAARPGAHRAVIVINGRRVMEKPFAIL